MPAVHPYQRMAIEQHEKKEGPVERQENHVRGTVEPFQLKSDRTDVAPGQEKQPSLEAWHVVQQKQHKVGAIAVVQRKEPWDSMAKEKWKDTVEKIEKYAHQIGNYDIEESDIIAYIINIENIEPPNEQRFKEPDYKSYCETLDNVDTGKAIEYATAAHQQREWLNYEVDDSESSDDEERYYSSEEDETPGNEADFDLIIAVIIALNKLLNEYISDLDPEKKFDKIAVTVIDNIRKHKQTSAYKREKKFPNSFNKVAVGGMEDWLSFASEFRYAKGGKSKQKPTVYNIEFGLWEKAKHKEIQFRGRQLKDAEGKPGRSWAAIALSLHNLAAELGAHLLGASNKKIQTEKGNQILAAAMLTILSGRGNEVYAVIQNYKIDQKVIHRFELLVLEFFALTMGIENIRLEFTQLDTIFHLNNIARGATYGQHNKKYNFLNVFSSIREIKTGRMVHVYDRARYRWKRRRDDSKYSQMNDIEIAEDIEDIESNLEVNKELTVYKGHRMRSKKESLKKPRDRGSIKSSKSVGKSIYSHSAGHKKTENLLFGVQSEINKLWAQVRPVKDDEDRRELHQSRLFSMGPIRLYNLFANLILRNREKLAELSAEQIAAFIIDLYINFVENRTPSSANPFHNEIEVISGSDFGATVEKILHGEDNHKPDKAIVELLVKALNGDREALGLIGTIDKLQLRIALINIDRSVKMSSGNLLHMAVASNDPALVATILSIGVDFDGEDNDGRTPLALMLELNKKDDNSKKIVDLLIRVQDKQKKKKKTQLPREWNRYSKFNIDANWLTNEEVDAGLAVANLPNTHVTPSVDIANNPDVLAEFIRDNYLDQMSHGVIAKNTVIPINFNNAHWATLVIRQNQDRRSAPEVYFFDSLGEDEEKIVLIKLMLQMTGVYTRANNIVDLSEYLQQDGYTCGTWMIESASKIVNILEIGGSVEDVKDALKLIGAVVKELHRQNIQLAKPGRKGKSKSGADVELESKEHVYHTFGDGMQVYSERWIEDSYNESFKFPTQLSELSQMLMVSYEDVDRKMQRIYLVYIYRIYGELNKTEELAEAYYEEIKEIVEFLK